MLSCWNEKPTGRPKFSLLKQKFSEILLSQRTTTNDYVVLGESSAAGCSVTEEEAKIPKSISMSLFSAKRSPIRSRCVSWNSHLPHTLAEKMESESSSPSSDSHSSMLQECPVMTEDTQQSGSTLTHRLHEEQSSKESTNGNEVKEEHNQVNKKD